MVIAPRGLNRGKRAEQLSNRLAVAFDEPVAKRTKFA